jgi:hypothetical protein
MVLQQLVMQENQVRLTSTETFGASATSLLTATYYAGHVSCSCFFFVLV